MSSKTMLDDWFAILSFWMSVVDGRDSADLVCWGDRLFPRWLDNQSLFSNFTQTLQCLSLPKADNDTVDDKSINLE